MIHRWRLSRDRERLLRPFSVLPVFWFLSLFLESVVVGIEMIERYTDWPQRVWRIAPLVTDVAVLSLLIWSCDDVVLLTRKRTRAVLSRLMHATRSPAATGLMRQLKESAAAEIMVFDAFAVNRSFLLAFLSSLLSFTLLFLDLLYDYVLKDGKTKHCSC